jgi:hypothetical protein
VTGPYVDYLCTDQYTLTFTQPLVVRGVFAGVVGADVLVAWFEQHLHDVLDVLDVLDVPSGGEDPCVLVNVAGRVVTSSDPTWVTGDLLRGLPLETWFTGAHTDQADWAFTRCGSLPLGVISRPD